MSRSRYHTPISGITTARSEKQDKKSWHSVLRSKVKQILHCDPTVEILPEDKDISNPWSMAKDGKHWWDGSNWERK